MTRYSALEATNVQLRRQVEQLELLCKEQAEAAQQLSKRQQVTFCANYLQEPNDFDGTNLLTLGSRSAGRATQSQNRVQSGLGKESLSPLSPPRLVFSAARLNSSM